MLARTCRNDLPAEIADAVHLAETEMRAIPKMFDDLNRAKLNFAILENAIDRLLVLSQEAADLEEQDQRGRDARQVEFVRLARTVAKVAGRDDYDQPRGLSLMSKAQAKAARTALTYLAAVKDDLAQRLNEQETNIIRAVEATLEFIKIVKSAYPDSITGSFEFPSAIMKPAGMPGRENLAGWTFDCGHC